METLKRAVDVTTVIDAESLRKFQVGIVVLCAVIAMLDGFDTQAIAYVAPAMAAQWKMPMASFGTVFGAGLFGLTVGAFVFGPLGDRYGRKRILVLCTLAFGALALSTAFAPDFQTLLILRVLTGIGLGGAMPNIIAMTSEYAPTRLRATVITVMFCGFPFGATLGAFLAARIIQTFGWSSVFLIGGALPLLLVPVLLVLLPESIRFLVARGRDPHRVAGILGRISASRQWNPVLEDYVLPEKAVTGFTVRHLFTEKRSGTTLLLWMAFFCNLLVMYFMINWMPAFLKQLGLPIETAITASAMLNAGGVVGGVALGRLIDRANPYLVLGTSYALAGLFIGMLAKAGSDLRLIIPAVFCAGIGVVGAQIGMNAVAAGVYPTALRSTGVGWALGIGRVGSIVGPTVGGMLLAAGWDPAAILMSAVAPALTAALAVFLLGWWRSAPAVREGAEAEAMSPTE